MSDILNRGSRVGETFELDEDPYSVESKYQDLEEELRYVDTAYTGGYISKEEALEQRSYIVARMEELYS